MRLKDRVAIVTGAARGIGQAYGLALACEGVKVVVADILPCTETLGAVFALTRALARELSGTGIYVNTITPGYTRTEAAQGLADPETVARIRAWVLDQHIIKCNEEPSDLTGPLVFLASEDSDFITGQTINVNGGATHH